MLGSIPPQNPVSFVSEFNDLFIADLVERSLRSSTRQVEDVLAKSNLSLGEFADLLSPAAATLLESLCGRSQQVTRQRFGMSATGENLAVDEHAVAIEDHEFD